MNDTGMAVTRRLLQFDSVGLPAPIMNFSFVIFTHLRGHSDDMFANCGGLVVGRGQARARAVFVTAGAGAQPLRILPATSHLLALSATTVYTLHPPK